MRVGVLGGGQLGRMLAQEGIPLGHSFTFLEPSPSPPSNGLGKMIAAPYDDPDGLARVAAASDVVTYEFENVPAGSAAYLAARLPALPPPAALEAAQDRVAEKEMFRALGVPTPRFRRVDRAADLEAALAATGLPAVIKTRRFGYDGKGQAVAATAAQAAEAVARLGPGLVTEEFVEFDRELSIIGAAGRDGGQVFYPLAENHHRDGILRVSYAPAFALPAPPAKSAPAPSLTAPPAASAPAPSLQAEAERLARLVMARLDYAGVLAIELFEAGGRLLANEIAPRVHNSGHWTLDGAETSQFDNHVRAVTGMPLAPPRALGPTAMINLIGELPDPDAVAAVPGARLHLYGKTPRPGRKLGHVNVVGGDEAAVMKSVERLWALLPGEDPLPRPTAW